jgi:hypothetical protein
VYASEVNDQRLMFEVAGVYRRNMIIRDRQTGTLWQHATGEALMGPLKGVQLQLLGGEPLVEMERNVLSHIPGSGAYS